MDLARLQEFTIVIKGLASVNKDERKANESKYLLLKKTDPNSLMVALVSVLSGNFDPYNKQQSAALLRQSLRSHMEKEFLWNNITEQTQQFVKSNLLLSIEHESHPLCRRAVCYVVIQLGEYLCDEEKNNWPELMQTSFRLVSSPENEKRESGLMILTGTVSSFGLVLLTPQKQEVLRLLKVSLDPAQSSVGVRMNASLLILYVVESLATKYWMVLQPLLTDVLHVLQSLCDGKSDELLKELLHGVVGAVDNDPLFFKPLLGDVLQMFLGLAAPQNLSLGSLPKQSLVDDLCRKLALDIVCSFAESKSKLCCKVLPSFPSDCVRTCMTCMLELDDDSVTEWMMKFDDPSMYRRSNNNDSDNDDDEDGIGDSEEMMFDHGMDCLDAIGKSLGHKVFLPAVFRLVSDFIQVPNRWQYKVAALMTVSTISEILEDNTHMTEALNLLLHQAGDPHPRVRYSVVSAIETLSLATKPAIQDETNAANVFPVLIRLIEDPIPRISAQACTAFVCFAEDGESDYLTPFVDSLMEKLYLRMAKGQPWQSRQEAVTAVAVVASVINQQFAKYYTHIMPILKEIITTCISMEERMLRGKAFECLSLLGVAVGRDVFRADAQEVMIAIWTLRQQKTSSNSTKKVDVDEGTFSEFMNESSQRIAGTLKEEFVQYIPHILPGLLTCFDFLTNVPVIDGTKDNNNNEDEDDDDEEYDKLFTSKLDDMRSALDTIRSYIDSTSQAYQPFVQATATKLLPLLLDETDEDIRSKVMEVWSSLISISTDPTISTELLSTVVRDITKSLQEERGEEGNIYTIEVLSTGLSECISSATVENLLKPEVVQQLISLVVNLMNDSFNRREKNHRGLVLGQSEEETNEDGNAAPQPRHDGDVDEDAVDAFEEDELQNEDLRISLANLVASIVQKNKRSFLEAGAFQVVITSLIQKCLTDSAAYFAASEYQFSRKDRFLALYTSCDLLEFLGSDSCPAWPIIMPNLLSAVTASNSSQSDEDLRQTACFGINVASRIPEFSQYAIQAAQGLGSVIRDPEARLKHNITATENAVAALGNLLENHQNVIEAVTGRDVIEECWKVWLMNLPLLDDEEEGQKTHLQLLNHLVNLNSPQRAFFLSRAEFVLKILQVCAKIFKKPNCSTDEINSKIVQVCKGLGGDAVMNLEKQLTPRDKRQLQRIFE